MISTPDTLRRIVAAAASAVALGAAGSALTAEALAGEAGTALLPGLQLDPGAAPALGMTNEPAAVERRGFGSSFLAFDGPWGRIEVGAAAGDTGSAAATGRAAGGGAPALSGWGEFLTLPGIPGLAPFDEFARGGEQRARAGYFTPRWHGLQFGAGIAADAGPTAAAGADFGTIYSLSVGYAERFGDVALSLSGIYRGARADSPDTEGMNIWSFGGRLGYRGFELGAGFADQGRTGLAQSQAATGADAGRRWDVGLGYTAGAWQIGAGYLQGWARNGGTAPESQIDVWSLTGGYTPAGGWDLRADLNFVEVDAANRTAGANATSTVVVISSILKF